MKSKLLILATCITLAFTANIAQSAQTLYKLGATPLIAPPLETVADLKNLVDTQGEDIKNGFTKAGNSELYTPFMEQFPQAEIETIKFQKGNTLKWMLYKKNGNVKVTKDVTWGAEEPFDAFKLHVDADGKRYNIVVPWACGNIALKNITATPAPVVVAPVAPVAPTPAPKEEVAAPVAPVTDEFIKNRLVADIAFMHQIDPASYLQARVGMEHRFNDNFSILGLVGAAPKLGGSDGTNAIVADVLANYRWDAFFVSLGLGAWITDGDSDLKAENSQLDVIADLGYRVWGEDNGKNAELFFEVRSGVEELDDINMYGRFGAGVRFRF